ncbi:MAG: glycosyltransferase family 1 protein [Candidatus Promineifilaceae bacterium]|nr:glycosyltransferase family 1 protein [Candidatus Promineifilaceae bacterium]
MYYVDVSAAVHARAGLGRYSERLARALADLYPGEIALFYNRGPEGQLPASLFHLPRRSVRMGYKPWRMAVLMTHLAFGRLDPLLPEARLFHSTEHLLLPLRSVPAVLTVHDLIFKLFPEYQKRLNQWYLNLAMPLYCRRADAIIAVSEASRRDIIEHYDVAPEKVHVVYEAAAPHFRPPSADAVARVRQQYQLPDDFVVHLSTIEPRKNLGRLVDALKQVRRDFPELRLVLVGAKGWLYDSFFARLEAEELSDVVVALGWVPDADLPAILAAARLAVQPSLYEGFGLPILEHMASGQVVAASRASSHPEVGGRAAAYFNPHDVEEMATVIRRLLLDDEECRERREAGLEQASRFSWERTARETMAVYQALLP